MKRLILFFFYIKSCVFFTNAQVTGADSVKAKFDYYLQNNFQEKLFIHTDKDIYVAGEIIWFKMYNVEAYTHKAAGLSKVAYIEVIDAENKPVLQTKVSLNSGRGDGSIYIPTSLESGNYVLRCYTSWMKNFNPDLFFHKTLSVYNTLAQENLKHKASLDSVYKIRFFPEGGNLVSKLTSRVAFKLVNNQGMGINCKGIILNHSNDTIVKFDSHKNGIGSFYLKADKKENYKVLIKPDGGESFTTFLPNIFAQGAVMTVTDSGSYLIATVENSLPQAENFFLLIHSGHRMVFSKTLDLKQEKEIVIPKADLGDGISHITLFNSLGEALCERLFFKKPKKLLKVQVMSDKLVYKQREKVRLSLFQEQSGQSEYSVSVYQSDSDLPKNDDISSYLWLTSELKGKVENATWYLHEASSEEVDYLMLTHGWRRFRWNEILEKSSPLKTYLPELDGHIITGKVSNSSGMPVANRIAYLSVPDTRYQFYTSSSDKEGKLSFHTRNFYGAKEVIAQLDNRLDSLIHIEINSPFSNKFSAQPYNSFHNPLGKDELLKKSIAMQVHNAYNTKQLNDIRSSASDLNYFYFKPDKVYKLDDYVRFTTMEEVLREYVPEITVSIRKNKYHLNVFDNSTGQFHSTSPLLLIDGVPLFDEGNSIMKMDPRKIQRLEIVSNTYTYGRNLFSGIASFHTYQGDLADYEISKKALVLDYDGLQEKREFYAPMYEGDVSQFRRIPDYRTTLFWSSSNMANGGEKLDVNFFTSDLEGNYIVDVQALSEDGSSGFAKTTFRVGLDKKQ